MKKSDVLSSWSAFETQFPEILERFKGSKRFVFIERYFAKGGVLSLGSAPAGNGWPELTYPTPMKIKRDLQQLENQKKDWEKKRNEWAQNKSRAEWMDWSNELKKFKEPVFWKHLQLYLTNKDYKKDADSVKLPVKLVSQKRWKPMIEMFVKDLEYRKQLTETVETSVVYAKDKRVAKFADLQREFRIEHSKKNLNQLQKRLDELDADIAMLRELENWSKK